MGDEQHVLIRFAKGLVGPEDILVGGTLRPEDADRLISLIEEDPFLKQVQTVTMGALRRTVDVFDIATRQLVRVAEGSEPGVNDLADVTEHGSTLVALDTQLYVTLKRSFFLDNQNRPNFVSEVEGALAAKLRNELTDLAFNGTADDNSAGFLTLNKGWIQIALDSGDTHQVDIDLATDGVRATLKNLLDAMPSKYRGEMAFIMSTKNADDYADELAGTEGIRIDSERAQRYLSYPILRSRHCPDTHILVTNPRNLAFGMVNNNMERHREYHGRKRAVEWTFNVWSDFEIAVKDACVIGKPGS